MPSVYVDVIGKCSILAGGATPPNNTAPLADPYPATGCPLPAAAAAAAYAQACTTSPPEASAASATSAASAPNRAAAPGAPGYGEAAPACAPAYREASAPASAGVSCRATSAASAAVESAAPTASAAVGCKSYALAELGFVFLVEDIKRPQADVSDFLFTENNFRTRCGLLQRYIRCRCSCVCAACHRQGHSGGPQYR